MNRRKFIQSTVYLGALSALPAAALANTSPDVPPLEVCQQITKEWFSRYRAPFDVLATTDVPYLQIHTYWWEDADGTDTGFLEFVVYDGPRFVWHVPVPVKIRWGDLFDQARQHAISLGADDHATLLGAFGYDRAESIAKSCVMEANIVRNERLQSRGSLV